MLLLPLALGPTKMLTLPSSRLTLLRLKKFSTVRRADTPNMLNISKHFYTCFMSLSVRQLKEGVEEGLEHY